MYDESLTAWIELEPGEKFICFGDLAPRIARALHPVPVEDEDFDFHFGCALMQFDEELKAAVRAENMLPRNPLTRGKHTFPIGAALDDSIICIAEVRAFALERGIGLRASVGYGFPKAEDDSLPTPAVRASFTQEPAPDRGRRVKRSALIADNVRRWPTIERDLKDAATNGLSKAAKDGADVGWWWEGNAVEWARARAKVQEVAPELGGMTRTIYRMRG